VDGKENAPRRPHS